MWCSAEDTGECLLLRPATFTCVAIPYKGSPYYNLSFFRFRIYISKVTLYRSLVTMICKWLCTQTTGGSLVPWREECGRLEWRHLAIVAEGAKPNVKMLFFCAHHFEVEIKCDYMSKHRCCCSIHTWQLFFKALPLPAPRKRRRAGVLAGTSMSQTERSHEPRRLFKYHTAVR